MNTHVFKGQRDKRNSPWLPVEVSTPNGNACLIWGYPLVQPQARINSPLINVSVETQPSSPGVSLPKSILDEKNVETLRSLIVFIIQHSAMQREQYTWHALEGGVDLNFQRHHLPALKLKYKDVFVAVCGPQLHVFSQFGGLRFTDVSCAAQWTPCEPPHTLLWLCCLHYWHLLCILYFLVEMSEASYFRSSLRRHAATPIHSNSLVPNKICKMSWKNIGCVWREERTTHQLNYFKDSGSFCLNAAWGLVEEEGSGQR